MLISWVFLGGPCFQSAKKLTAAFKPWDYTSSVLESFRRANKVERKGLRPG